MSDMIFLSCRYQEPDPKTYQGIELKDGHTQSVSVFFSGNPTVDYITAWFVLRGRCERAGVELRNVRVSVLSSLDHFVMDGGDLREDEHTPAEVAEATRLAHEHIEKEG